MVVDWLVFAPFGDAVFLDCILERHEFLLLVAVVAYADCCGVDKFNHTVAFGHNLCAGIAHELAFDTGADDRSLRAHQRHSLAHHVRAHERAVGVVVRRGRG